MAIVPFLPLPSSRSSKERVDYSNIIDAVPSGYQPPVSNVVHLDPQRFLSIFDIPTELTRNRDIYTGTDYLTIFGLPTMVTTCIDRVRAEIKQNTSVSLVFNCALHRGMEDLSRSPVVTEARLLKQRLNKVVNVDAHELELVLGWLRSFALPAVAVSSASKRTNIRLPEGLHNAVLEVASDLGASPSVLATTAVLHTLSMQAYLLPAHRDLFSDQVADFYNAVEIRQHYTEAVVDKLIERGNR